MGVLSVHSERRRYVAPVTTCCPAAESPSEVVLQKLSGVVLLIKRPSVSSQPSSQPPSPSPLRRVFRCSSGERRSMMRPPVQCVISAFNESVAAKWRVMKLDGRMETQRCLRILMSEAHSC